MMMYLQSVSSSSELVSLEDICDGDDGVGGLTRE